MSPQSRLQPQLRPFTFRGSCPVHSPLALHSLRGQVSAQGHLGNRPSLTTRPSTPSHLGLTHRTRGPSGALDRRSARCAEQRSGVVRSGGAKRRWPCGFVPGHLVVNTLLQAPQMQDCPEGPRVPHTAVVFVCGFGASAPELGNCLVERPGWGWAGSRSPQRMRAMQALASHCQRKNSGKPRAPKPEKTSSQSLAQARGYFP